MKSFARSLMALLVGVSVWHLFGLYLLCPSFLLRLPHLHLTVFPITFPLSTERKSPGLNLGILCELLKDVIALQLSSDETDQRTARAASGSDVSVRLHRHCFASSPNSDRTKTLDVLYTTHICEAAVERDSSDRRLNQGSRIHLSPSRQHHEPGKAERSIPQNSQLCT